MSALPSFCSFCRSSGKNQRPGNIECLFRLTLMLFFSLARKGRYVQMARIGRRVNISCIRTVRLDLSKRWSVCGEGCRTGRPSGRASIPGQSSCVSFQLLLSLLQEVSRAGERGSNPNLLSRNLESYHLLCIGLYFHFSSVFSWLDTSFL